MIAGAEGVGDFAVHEGEGHLGVGPLADGIVVGDIAQMEDVFDVSFLLVLDDPGRLGQEDAGVILGIELGVGQEGEGPGARSKFLDSQRRRGDVERFYLAIANGQGVASEVAEEGLADVFDSRSGFAKRTEAYFVEGQ